MCGRGTSAVRDFARLENSPLFYRSVGVQKDILTLLKSLASQQSLKYEKVCVHVCLRRLCRMCTYNPFANIQSLDSKFVCVCVCVCVKESF